jgi:predicted HTH domain antitoxin
MSVVISDGVLQAANLSGDELLQELALLLFEQNRLTLAQASRLAQLDRISFQQLLASRNLPIHYDVNDFEEDLTTLRGMGQL